MTYFVAGTDTDSGKTLVSSALLHLAERQGKTSLGLKPIASGSHYHSIDGELVLQNADALSLMESSSITLPYQVVNPFTFEPAIAPHIAATQVGIELTVRTLVKAIDLDAVNSAELGLIEGAGGWRLPLNQDEFLPDLIRELSLPVILVVGVKLGCLNHALLTQEAILADGLKIAGWVANQVDEEVACLRENLQYLHSHIDAPCLGSIPYLKDPSPENAAIYLDLTPLC